MTSVISAAMSAINGSWLCSPGQHSEEASVTRPFPVVTASFGRLLLVLLVIDFTFILVNILAAIAKDLDLIAVVPPMLKITQDRALPEDFNYLKWLVICVGLVWMGLRDRWLAPALWAAVFLIILIDDSFQLHEHIGSQLAGWLDLPDYALLYGNDVGEVAVFAAMGLLALAIVGVLFGQRDQASRLLSRRYLLIVLALGFFGVGIDVMHSVVAHLTQESTVASILAQIFGVIEDGGEMLVASLAVALTLVPDAGRNKLQSQRS
jgi:hypothetical protein